MQNTHRLRIATRQSLLALWQANYVKQELQNLVPDLEVELVPMTTQGDIHLSTRLQNIGGKGLFVKELEVALLEDRADIAVHSIKDMPMDFSPSMCLAAICERADPRDAFVSNHYNSVAELPVNAVIGTSSLRRQCQLYAMRPDIQVEPLRGNVDSRLKKINEGTFSAIVLAAAGIHRLQATQQIKQYLTTDESLPAIGQGAIGIECRENDAITRSIVKVLNHEPTAACVTAERAMGRRLGAGCHVPIAAYAILENNLLRLQGLVGTPDGKKILRNILQGPIVEMEELGIALAESLLDQGAGELLKQQ